MGSDWRAYFGNKSKKKKKKVKTEEHSSLSTAFPSETLSPGCA